MIKNKSGFTLIELLVVIAIIGILTAIALPLYRGHIVMAKLAEVENAMATVASGATSYYRDENSWPNCPTINDVTNSLGVWLSSISRISAISISSVDGTITATIQNINFMVDNKTLTLTPTPSSDSSIKWTWGWCVDFPPQFRPKNN